MLNAEDSEDTSHLSEETMLNLLVAVTDGQARPRGGVQGAVAPPWK